jgi:hypothetical protein
MFKRGQNWSLEIMIALSVFIVIFVLTSVFMFYLPAQRANEFGSDTQQILGSLETDVGLYQGNVVDSDVARELDDVSCDELRDLLKISGEVCVHFEALDGSIIPLENGKLGFGCSGITFGSYFDGGSEVILACGE